MVKGIKAGNLNGCVDEKSSDALSAFKSSGTEWKSEREGGREGEEGREGGEGREGDEII
mgnify:CR=1 FL=1